MQAEAGLVIGPRVGPLRLIMSGPGGPDSNESVGAFINSCWGAQLCFNRKVAIGRASGAREMGSPSPRNHQGAFIDRLQRLVDLGDQLAKRSRVRSSKAVGLGGGAIGEIGLGSSCMFCSSIGLFISSPSHFISFWRKYPAASGS
jgi:hypothetical protein